MHTLHPDVVEGLVRAVDMAEERFQAVVIWSGDEVFSAGADLQALLPAYMTGGSKAIEPVEAQMQQAFLRVRYAQVPVVAAVHGVIAGRIALGLNPVIVTIHSFTPVYFGKPRAVEFGVIHDEDPSYAKAILAAAQATTNLRAELNAPYSAADDVTHSLRVLATPYGLPNAMLEIRNDLIGSPEAEEAMAEALAPVLNMGLVEIQKQAKAG